MNRTRFAVFLTYAAAVGVVEVAAVAIFVALKPQAALDLWWWAIGVAQAKWRGPASQVLFFTTALIVMELFLLSWEKTTVFRVFVRRSASAIMDLCFALVTFSSLKWLLDYIFTFGVAFAAVKLSDALTTRLGWMRWELPTDGVFEVAGAFAVYFLLTTFVGYWQHRLMHWRWFWHLHRFHHAATDFNIFTGFRANPAEMISNLIPALSPLVLLKVPHPGLFSAFVFVNLTIAQLQHSELPWSFGWIGRWLVTSPQMHQIHHSIDEEHRDRNFSNCPLWDQLFGTYYGGPNRPSPPRLVRHAPARAPVTPWARRARTLCPPVARAPVAPAPRPRAPPAAPAARTPATLST